MGNRPEQQTANNEEFDRKRRLIFLGGSAFSVLFGGTVVYHFLEGWRWLDAFYFSAITLTTVGYGDMAPATDFGKLFTVFYIISGIGLIFGFIDALFSHRTERVRKRGKQVLLKKVFPPVAGEKDPLEKED